VENAISYAEFKGKKHSKAFEYLKRGDVISVDQPVALGEDMQITEKTIVELKAPCDKPVII
jgi:hypothetical protein